MYESDLTQEQKFKILKKISINYNLKETLTLSIDKTKLDITTLLYFEIIKLDNLRILEKVIEEAYKIIDNSIEENSDMKIKYLLRLLVLSNQEKIKGFSNQHLDSILYLYQNGRSHLNEPLTDVKWIIKSKFHKKFQLKMDFPN